MDFTWLVRGAAMDGPGREQAHPLGIEAHPLDFPTKGLYYRQKYSSVLSAIRVSGLRPSCRWRSQVWRSWAGVVIRGLRLWGRLDVLPNSLKPCWRRLMVEKWTLHSLLDIPAVGMPIARCTFFVLSTRCTCVMIMLFNQLLNMPQLSGGWIILAKEKCSLTGM
jgi:hypothetical protein